MVGRIVVTIALLAVTVSPAFASKITSQSGAGETVAISSVGSDGFGYAVIPAPHPMFEVDDDKGNPVNGAVVYFACSGPFACPAFKNYSATTATVNRMPGIAMPQFGAPFKVAIPKPPPSDYYYPIAFYKICAGLTSSAVAGCASANSSTPQLRVWSLKIACNTSFAPCVPPTPAPKASAAPTAVPTAAPPIGTLSLVGTSPVPASMVKAGSGDLILTTRVKLLDPDGKPIKGKTLVLSMGKVGPYPAQSGTGMTDATGVAVVRVDYLGPGLTQIKSGDTFAGTVTVQGLSNPQLSVTFKVQ